MLPYKFVEFIDDLSSLVKKNMMPISGIDGSGERILRVKFILGFFENPMADRTLASKLGSQVDNHTFFSLNLSHFHGKCLLRAVFLQT